MATMLESSNCEDENEEAHFFRSRPLGACVQKGRYCRVLGANPFGIRLELGISPPPIHMQKYGIRIQR